RLALRVRGRRDPDPLPQQVRTVYGIASRAGLSEALDCLSVQALASLAGSSLVQRQQRFALTRSSVGIAAREGRQLAFQGQGTPVVPGPPAARAPGQEATAWPPVFRLQAPEASRADASARIRQGRAGSPAAEAP